MNIFRLLVSVVSNRYFLLASMVVLTSLLYYQTLDAPFVLDDHYMITTNPIVRDLGHITSPRSAADHNEYGLFIRRFLGFATFAMSYSISGVDATGFRLFNVALHILNSILIYCLFRHIFRTPRLIGDFDETKSFYYAFLPALIFAVHPLQTEAVIYIYQRVTLLAGLIYIITSLLYIRARTLVKGPQSNTCYAFALMAALAGPLAKENVLMLPAVMVLVEFALFKESLKRRFALLAPFFLSYPIYVLALHETGLSLKLIIRGGDPAEFQDGLKGVFENDYLMPSKNRWDYFRTQFGVRLAYLRMFFLPIGQSFEHSYAVIERWGSARFIISLLAHLAIIASGILAYMMSIKRRRGPLMLIALGLGWYLATLTVESSFVPLPLSMTEYRTYTPCIGVLMALSGAFALLKDARVQRAIGGLIAIVAVVLALTTHYRSGIWESEISLWRDAASKSPDSSRAQNNLALAYKKSGNYAQAMRHYREALRIEPGYPGGYMNIGNIYLAEGRLQEATAQYLAAISIDESFVPAYVNLGIVSARMGEIEKAVSYYEHSISLNPELWQAHYNLGNLRMRTGDSENALHNYEAALQLRPDHAPTHRKVADICTSKGDRQKAEYHLDRAREIERRQRP